jgi:hypothetical protein
MIGKDCISTLFTTRLRQLDGSVSLIEERRPWTSGTALPK